MAAATPIIINFLYMTHSPWSKALHVIHIIQSLGCAPIYESIGRNATLIFEYYDTYHIVMIRNAPPTMGRFPFHFHRRLANLRVPGIIEMKLIPLHLLRILIIDRLLEIIKRKCLDQILMWNAYNLTRKLDSFQNYYNTNNMLD